MTNPSSCKLSIRELYKSYGGVPALEDISFDVREGEFLSFLGPSGCGKTTLLRILVGLLAPDAGTVYKDGVDITNLPPAKRGMGIVFQNYALFENMTVRGNVEYALKLRKDRREGARAAANRMLEVLGISELAGKKPSQLSGGQQQRVAIARTLVLEPDIMLFDEPMSALDVATRLSLRRELKRIQAEFGTTMIYITHDQEEAFALSDRIMIMDKAHIEQLDTPERIVAAPASRYVQEFVLDNLRAKVDSIARYIQ